MLCIFALKCCPQILPSSDMKPALEWTLLCILNYKSCNLHKSDNSSQLMLKHFSSLQAIPLKKETEEQPLAQYIAFHPPHGLVHAGAARGGILHFWVENKTDCVKSAAFHWDISQTLYNSSSQPCWLFFSKLKFTLFYAFPLLLKKKVLAHKSPGLLFWNTLSCPNIKLSDWASMGFPPTPSPLRLAKTFFAAEIKLDTL